MRGTDSATNAEAKLIVNPHQLDATLTVSNLSPLPQGKVYALWTVVGKEAPFTTDSKGAILTEVFQVNERGEVLKTIAVPRVHRNNEQIPKMAITIETESAPQAHTGSTYFRLLARYELSCFIMGLDEIIFLIPIIP